MQTASLNSVQRGKKRGKNRKKTHLKSGKTFLEVQSSGLHALTTYYIPHMFYKMLQPSDGSLKKKKKRGKKCNFCQGLHGGGGFACPPGARACAMQRGAGEDRHTTRIIPSRDCHTPPSSFFTPPSLLVLGLTFSNAQS